jgi:hypothetical protein
MHDSAVPVFLLSAACAGINPQYTKLSCEKYKNRRKNSPDMRKFSAGA